MQQATAQLSPLQRVEQKSLWSCRSVLLHSPPVTLLQAAPAAHQQHSHQQPRLQPRLLHLNFLAAVPHQPRRTLAQHLQAYLASRMPQG